MTERSPQAEMSSYEIIRRPLSLMVDVLNDEACRDALLAIERIEKRNEALAMQIDEARQALERSDALLSQAGRALEAAEADRDRLAAALTEIVEWDCPTGYGGTGFGHVRQIARFALAGKNWCPDG